MTDETKVCAHCAATMPIDTPVCTDCGRDFDAQPGVLLRRRRFDRLRRRFGR